MAARLPRRSFATPFVVTLAAAVPACFVDSNPRPQPPPQRTTTAPPVAEPSQPPPVVIANPPRQVEPTPAPNQPGTRPPIAVTNPPTQTAEVTPAPRKPPGGVIANPPRPTSDPAPLPSTPPGGVIANPPRPTSATTERRWQVTRRSGKCTYHVILAGSSESGCPSGPPGGPVPTCNPPPPRAVACPDRTADGETFQIVQRAGESTCTVIDAPMTCPKGAMCNPPPPRRATCPQ